MARKCNSCDISSGSSKFAKVHDKRLAKPKWLVSDTSNSRTKSNDAARKMHTHYIYTQRQNLSTIQNYFRDGFHLRFSSKTKQSFCNILSSKSCFGLSNLSECHLTLLLKFYGVLYTQPLIWGISLKVS